MKLPFLNIWITRTDWAFLYNYERGVLKNERKAMNDYIVRHKRCDDCQKYKSKFKALHDQLRAEVNNQTIGHYDDIKKAGK